MIGSSDNLMSKISFFMTIYMRRSIWHNLKGLFTLIIPVISVGWASLFMGWNRLLEPNSISSATFFYLTVVLTHLYSSCVIPRLFVSYSCTWMITSSLAALPHFCTTSYTSFPLSSLWKILASFIIFWGSSYATPDMLFLSQHKYLQDLLTKF